VTDVREAPVPATDAPPPPIEALVADAPPTVEGEGRVSEFFRNLTRRDVMLIVGRGLIVFGVLVALYMAYLLVISGLEHGVDQRGLEDRFRATLAAGRAPIGGSIREGRPVARLQIPAIGVDEIVVEGTRGTLLKRGPGHLRASPLPGQAGNVVIMGRRVAYGGPFDDIGALDVGDVIRTVTGQGRARYEVVSVHNANKDGTSVVARRAGNRLTLVTSTPRLRAERRKVVDARLIGRPEGTPPGRPGEMSRAELGLQSDSAGIVPLLMWSELLLLAACAAVWLSRRWGRWTTYLVAMPVLALLLLLVFDSATTLLPSTL
jgi:LPXTG-site transpeptidase (sortase) family protein